MIDRDHINSLKQNLSLATCWSEPAVQVFARTPEPHRSFSVRTASRDYEERVCPSCKQTFKMVTGTQVYCSLGSCQSKRRNTATQKRVDGWRERQHTYKAYSAKNRKCRLCYLSERKGPHEV